MARGLARLLLAILLAPDIHFGVHAGLSSRTEISYVPAEGYRAGLCSPTPQVWISSAAEALVASHNDSQDRSFEFSLKVFRQISSDGESGNCLDVASASNFMRAFADLCQRATPKTAIALGFIELVPALSSLSTVTAVDLSCCGVHGDNPAAISPEGQTELQPPTDLERTLPAGSGSIAFCLPINRIPCALELVWGAARELLVPYVGSVGHMSSLAYLLHPRAADYVRRLLAFGMRMRIGSNSEHHRHHADAEVNATSGAWVHWHPSGLPPADTNALVRTSELQPGYAFYFSTSYHALQLERQFKAALHQRYASCLNRVPSIAQAADEMLASTSSLIPRFTLLNDASRCKTQVLVIDAFWYRGFASHRVTTPLVNHMLHPGSGICGYLLYGYQGSRPASSSSASSASASTAALIDDSDDDASRAGFVQAIGAPVWDEAITGSAWRLATVRSIAGTSFDAVWFASVGMSSFDIAMASFRMAPVQAMSVGHPASTGSSNMDYYVSGILPEVIGPIAADIHAIVNSWQLQDAMGPDGSASTADCSAFGGDCRPVLAAINAAVTASCSAVQTVDEGARLASFRPPLISACDTASGGRQPVRWCECCGHPNATAAQLMLKLLSQTMLSRCRPYGFDLSPSASLPFPQQLESRLLDAQARYSERLVLVPGIGMGLTDLVTTAGVQYRPVLPSIDVLPLEQLQWMSRAVSSLAASAAPSEGQARAMLRGHERHPTAMDTLLGVAAGANSSDDGARAGHNFGWKGSSPTDPLIIAVSWSNPKWQYRHAHRLMRCVAVAQAAFRLLWHRCELSHLRNLPICADLHERISSPVLHVRLDIFTPMDALRSLAFRAVLGRMINATTTLHPGSVSINHVRSTSSLSEYLRLLSAAHVAVDSQPFAGGNTMQDMLSVGLPMVSLAHDGENEPAHRGPTPGSTLEDGGSADSRVGAPTPLRWRSALGSSILTKLGLSGLVALDEDDLFSKVAALAVNPFLRALWSGRIVNHWRGSDHPATADAPVVDDYSADVPTAAGGDGAVGNISPHGILTEEEGRCYAATMLTLARTGKVRPP